MADIDLIQMIVQLGVNGVLLWRLLVADKKIEKLEKTIEGYLRTYWDIPAPPKQRVDETRDMPRT